VVELAERAEVAELVELAERAGMTQPQVSRMEGGDTVPTLPVLRRLAKVLDGTLNWPSMRVTPRHLHLARRLKPTPSRSVEDSEPVSEVAPPTSWEKMSSPTSTRSTVRRRS
jgi:transcriptional regulator with XRE-family HTH domain